MKRIIHSYYLMFAVLTQAFYGGCGEKDESLAPLMGVMDPNGPFADGPADMAIYRDWTKYIGSEAVDRNNILEKTVGFF